MKTLEQLWDELRERRELRRGDEVWIRGKVMCVFPDEISVAPYCHRNAGGSVAVKREDILGRNDAVAES